MCPYSLPLAPGQKKQIAVVDWERRETSARTELLSESERLDAYRAAIQFLGLASQLITQVGRGHADSSISYAGPRSRSR